MAVHLRVLLHSNYLKVRKCGGVAPIFLTIRIRLHVNLGTLLLSSMVLQVRESINALMFSVNVTSR